MCRCNQAEPNFLVQCELEQFTSNWRQRQVYVEHYDLHCDCVDIQQPYLVPLILCTVNVLTLKYYTHRENAFKLSSTSPWVLLRYALHRL